MSLEEQEVSSQENDFLVLSSSDDANIAAVRASQLLFRVLSQCSVRLGFASLNPKPLQIQNNTTNNNNNHHHHGISSSASIPVLFSTWAAEECANFLQLFELERSASGARQKLIQISLKIRFREKLLDDRLAETKMEVWEKRVRESQRELYRQISGKSLAIRTRLTMLRKKLRDKSISILPLQKEMAAIYGEIKILQQSLANTSKVEFKLEAQLMRLVLVNRECQEKLESNTGRGVLGTSSSATFYQQDDEKEMKKTKSSNDVNQGIFRGPQSTISIATTSNHRQRSPSPPLQLRDIISVIESPQAYLINNNSNQTHFVTTSSVSDPLVTASHHYAAHGTKRVNAMPSQHSSSQNSNKNIVALPSLKQKTFSLVGPSRFLESPSVDSQMVVISGDHFVVHQQPVHTNRKSPKSATGMSKR